jgi:hypothetical protein
VTLTVNSTAHAYSNRTANFSQALAPGQSYTLVVDFDRLVFARSNIIWDNANSKLTFAVTAADNVAIPANVQGLVFKWGSLVALTATRTHVTTESPYYGSIYYTDNIVYSPSGNKTYSAGDIPYISETTPPFDFSDWTDDDLAAYNNNTGFDAAADKGDICRYISAQGWVNNEGWRMPTLMELYDLMMEKTVAYGTYILYYGNSLPRSSEDGGAYGRGYWPMSYGFLMGSKATTGVNISNPSVGIFFPASGLILFNGTPEIQGGRDFIPSASSFRSTIYGFGCASFLRPSSGEVYSTNSLARQNYAVAVRCVRTL